MKRETEYIVFGEMVRHRRELFEITQAELAEFIGLSRVSIATIESGKQRVMLHHVFKLCERLTIPMRQLEEQIKKAKKEDT